MRRLDITYTTKLAWLVGEVVLFPGAGLPQRALDDDLRAPAHPGHRAEETVGVGDLWNRITIHHMIKFSCPSCCWLKTKTRF